MVILLYGAQPLLTVSVTGVTKRFVKTHIMFPLISLWNVKLEKTYQKGMKLLVVGHDKGYVMIIRKCV